MPTNRKRRTRKARGNYTPFERAILTDSPIPTGSDAGLFGADGRVADPFAPGLVPDTQRSIAELWAEWHGVAMTEAEAAAIRAREDEVAAALAAQRARESGASEAEIAVADLAERYERARIDALPVAHRVGISDAEKAEAEARRAEAEAERDRLAAELAEARARVTAPGSSSPSNWPEGQTEGFIPKARK